MSACYPRCVLSSYVRVSWGHFFHLRQFWDSTSASPYQFCLPGLLANHITSRGITPDTDFWSRWEVHLFASSRLACVRFHVIAATSRGCTLVRMFWLFRRLSRMLSINPYPYVRIADLTIGLCRGIQCKVPIVYSQCTIYPVIIRFPPDSSTLPVLRWHLELLVLKLRPVVRFFHRLIRRLSSFVTVLPSTVCFVFAVNVRVK